jgi:phage-related protein
VPAAQAIVMAQTQLSEKTLRALQALSVEDVEDVIQELAALQERGRKGAALMVQKAGADAFHIRRYDETDSYRSTTRD